MGASDSKDDKLASQAAPSLEFNAMALHHTAQYSALCFSHHDMLVTDIVHPEAWDQHVVSTSKSAAGLAMLSSRVPVQPLNKIFGAVMGRALEVLLMEEIVEERGLALPWVESEEAPSVDGVFRDCVLVVAPAGKSFQKSRKASIETPGCFCVPSGSHRSFREVWVVPSRHVPSEKMLSSHGPESAALLQCPSCRNVSLEGESIFKPPLELYLQLVRERGVVIFQSASSTCPRCLLRSRGESSKEHPPDPQLAVLAARLGLAQSEGNSSNASFGSSVHESSPRQSVFSPTKLIPIALVVEPNAENRTSLIRCLIATGLVLPQACSSIADVYKSMDPNSRVVCIICPFVLPKMTAVDIVGMMTKKRLKVQQTLQNHQRALASSKSLQDLRPDPTPIHSPLRAKKMELLVLTKETADEEIIGPSVQPTSSRSKSSNSLTSEADSPRHSDPSNSSGSIAASRISSLSCEVSLRILPVIAVGNPQFRVTATSGGCHSFVSVPPQVSHLKNALERVISETV